MNCEICGTDITVSVKRYQTELFLDGKRYSDICMCCASFAQLYFKNTTYGILTGLMTGSGNIKELGFNDAEIRTSEIAMQQMAHENFVSKIHKPLILTTLVLPPISFLDLGVRYLDLNQDPDSDVLIELD